MQPFIPQGKNPHQAPDELVIPRLSLTREGIFPAPASVLSGWLISHWAVLLPQGSALRWLHQAFNSAVRLGSDSINGHPGICGESVGPGSIYSASRLGRMLLSSVEDSAFLAGFVLCVGMGLMHKERYGVAETMYPVSFPWALAHKGLHSPVSTDLNSGSWAAFWGSKGCFEMLFPSRTLKTILPGTPVFSSLATMTLKVVCWASRIWTPHKRTEPKNWGGLKGRHLCTFKALTLWGLSITAARDYLSE